MTMQHRKLNFPAFWRFYGDIPVDNIQQILKIFLVFCYQYGVICSSEITYGLSTFFKSLQIFYFS